MAEFNIKIDFDKEKFLEMIHKFKEEHPDFLEVVRCKDCVNYKKVPEGDWTCQLDDYCREADDFCSYGERSEDND